MSALNRLLRAAIHPLRNEMPASPVKPLKSPPEPSSQPNVQFHLPAFAMNNFTKQYFSSPLRQCAAAKIGDIDDIFTSHEVQRAAATCCTKLAELADIACHRSEVAGAIEAVIGPERALEHLTEARVLGVLNRRAEEIDDAIAEARVDKAEHQSVHRANLQNLRPLSVAVSALVTSLVNERAVLDGRLVAMKTHSSIDAATTRFEALKAQGLTNDQINALGATRPDVEAAAEKMRARIVEIDGIVARCRAFLANQRDFSPLDGLGLDQLVDARRSVLQVPA